MLKPKGGISTLKLKFIELLHCNVNVYKLTDASLMMGVKALKPQADDVIGGHFLKTAHWEWIIDPLRLLMACVLCECRASSCVITIRARAPVKTPCLLSEPEQSLHYSLSVRWFSGFLSGMTSPPLPVIHLQERLVQMHILQLSYVEGYFRILSLYFKAEIKAIFSIATPKLSSGMISL